ncbi:MAG: sigma-70 family RNA polymerase sigma factor [Deltaproteobacteria bacterium]|nr:sigma-70 family RNA polymerase sigma factor [Deltaproteobacteria bacterium]
MTSAQDPDKELVQRIQNGDRPAFNQLVLKYRNRVMGIAARMLGDRGEAEELAQDVFVKVYRALGDFQGAALFSTWLFRVTVNSCLNHRRKRRAEVRILDGAGDAALAVADPSSNPHQLLEQKELRIALEKSIQSLPEEQRIVLILRDVEGLSYEEIADSLELELGTVRSRLHRARLQVQAGIREKFSLDGRRSDRL